MYDIVNVNTLPGFENVNENYTIDIYGVLRAGDKILKQGDNGKGYKGAQLFIRSNKRGVKSKSKHVYIHRLVALAFVDNPDNKPEVDHDNCIRDDNRANNLKWVDRIENMNNPITKQNMIGMNSNGKCYVYDFMCNFIGEFESLLQASAYTKTTARIDRKVGKYFFLSVNDVRRIPEINKKCKANSIVITQIYTREKHYFYSNREARRFFNGMVNITDCIKYDATLYGLYKVRNLNYKKLIDSLDL